MSKKKPAMPNDLISEKLRRSLESMSKDLLATLKMSESISQVISASDTFVNIAKQQEQLANDLVKKHTPLNDLMKSLSQQIITNHKTALSALAASNQLYQSDLLRTLNKLMQGYLNEDARRFVERVLEEDWDEVDEAEVKDWRETITQQPMLYLIVIILLINLISSQIRSGKYPAWTWNLLSESLIALSDVIESQQHEQLANEIETILADAKPETLVPGTMDVDKLAAAMEAMREGLTDSDLDEIAQAMNEEYIKPADEPA